MNKPKTLLVALSACFLTACGETDTSFPLSGTWEFDKEETLARIEKARAPKPAKDLLRMIYKNAPEKEVTWTESTVTATTAGKSNEGKFTATFPRKNQWIVEVIPAAQGTAPAPDELDPMTVTVEDTSTYSTSVLFDGVNIVEVLRKKDE